MARPGKAWQGMARQGEAWLGEARCGLARQGEVSNIKLMQNAKQDT